MDYYFQRGAFQTKGMQHAILFKSYFTPKISYLTPIPTTRRHKKPI